MIRLTKAFIVFAVLVVLATFLPNQGVHAQDSHSLNNQTRFVINDDFDRNSFGDELVWRSFPLLTGKGNCTRNTKLVDLSLKTYAINLSAHALNPLNRTTLLLGRKFDLSKIPKCAQIGFNLTLQIVSTGHIFDAIVGIASWENVLALQQNGISNAWPLCVAFRSNQDPPIIEFQNASLTHYANKTWYQVEVMFDQHTNKWELKVISSRGTFSTNSSFSENFDFDATFRASSEPTYFVVGFDGTKPYPCVLLDKLQLFYVLPDFKVTPIPATSEIVVEAGQSLSFNATVEISEILDLQFSLSLSGLPSGSFETSYPKKISTGSFSTMSISTSQSTPPGTYPITLQAISQIPETQENITRSLVLNLKVTSSPNHFWSQSWFWLGSIALAISIALSAMFTRSKRKIKTVATKTHVGEKDKQGFLTCNNPKCGFKELPIDSKHCPICGESVKER